MEAMYSGMKRMRGLLFVALSAVSCSLVSLYADLATVAGVPATVIVAGGGIGMTFLSLMIIVTQKLPLRIRGASTLLFMGGLFGTLSIGSFFYSLKGLQLADASAIIFSSPVYTSLIACIVLSERFTRLETIVVFLSMCGVVAIARPPLLLNSAVNYPIMRHMLYALSSAVFSSCTYVIIRKLRYVPIAVIVFYFGVVSSVLSSGLMITLNEQVILPETRITLFLFGTTFFGFAGHMLLSRGLQLEKAGQASVMRNLGLPCALLWRTTATSDGWTAAGVCLILLSGFLLLLNKIASTTMVLSVPPDRKSNGEFTRLVSGITVQQDDEDEASVSSTDGDKDVELQALMEQQEIPAG